MQILYGLSFPISSFQRMVPAHVAIDLLAFNYAGM